MTPKDAGDYAAVETAADFVEYLYLLSEEYSREAKAYPNPIMSSGNWAQRDIGIFLERWGSWLQAMGVEGRPHTRRSCWSRRGRASRGSSTRPAATSDSPIG